MAGCPCGTTRLRAVRTLQGASPEGSLELQALGCPESLVQGA